MTASRLEAPAPFALLDAAGTAPVAPGPMSLHTSIDEVPEGLWRERIGQDRPYLDASYLRALEEAAPPRLAFRYAVFAEGAVASFQMIDVEPRQCLPGVFRTRAEEPLWLRLVRRTADLALGEARSQVIVCGNVFAGGQPGLAWARPCDTVAAFTRAAAALEAMRDGRPAPIVCFKDIEDGWLPDARRALLPRGYRELTADPVMVLTLRPQWRRLDDYLAALTARYRGHARRALRDSAAIERRLLTADEIAQAADRIDRLHGAVLARATIRPSSLNARAFVALRSRLKDRFELIGYYQGSELVAFNTRFWAGDDLDSHYFGLDYEANRQYALYRSMLYDDIACALERGARRVLFGRTSQELKSALGARPVRMSWFGKAGSPLATRLVTFLAGLSGDTWIDHQPFRGAAPQSPYHQGRTGSPDDLNARRTGNGTSRSSQGRAALMSR